MLSKMNQRHYDLLISKNCASIYFCGHLLDCLAAGCDKRVYRTEFFSLLASGRISFVFVSLVKPVAPSSVQEFRVF
jgi:hypothetical protein